MPKVSIGEPNPAFIVFRHADDNNHSEDWDDNHGKGFDYVFPNGDTFTLDHIRLNDTGKNQAKVLGEKLTNWMKGMGYSPVGRVITQKPNERNGQKTTPNPFCTVYPAIDPHEGHHPETKKLPVEIKFYLGINNLTEKIKANPKAESFRAGGYSTLVCMTRQDMWSTLKEDADHHLYPSKGSLFDIITKGSTEDKTPNPDREKLKHEPEKCRYIYAFTQLNNNGKFDKLDVFTLHMTDGSIRPYKKGDSLKGH